MGVRYSSVYGTGNVSCILSSIFFGLSKVERNDICMGKGFPSFTNLPSHGILSRTLVSRHNGVLDGDLGFGCDLHV